MSNGLAPKLRGEWIPTFDVSVHSSQMVGIRTYFDNNFSRRFFVILPDVCLLSVLIDGVQVHFIEFRFVYIANLRDPTLRPYGQGLFS